MPPRDDTLYYQTPTRRSLPGGILLASASYAFAIPLGFLFAVCLSMFFRQYDAWLFEGVLIGLAVQLSIALIAGVTCALALFFRKRSNKFPRATHALLPAFLFSFLTTATWSLFGEFGCFPPLPKLALGLVAFGTPSIGFPLLYALRLIPPIDTLELLNP